jgi:hypothetical protein
MLKNDSKILKAFFELSVYENHVLRSSTLVPAGVVLLRAL